jgi:hypothetical protein
MGHLAVSGQGEGRVSSGMIDVLNNESLTFVLPPLISREAIEDGSDL